MSISNEESNRTKNPVRFVTAASLFDGHDASINIMRRILQDRGVEVIHLGHDRSAQEIVETAIQEDAHGIAVSSYQGGHMEFFTYMVDLLREAGRADVKVFGGGGGTITDKEIEELHTRGVAHIYSVEDGRRMGLVGMIEDMISQAHRPLLEIKEIPKGFFEGSTPDVARVLSWIEMSYLTGMDEVRESLCTSLRASLNAPHSARIPPLILGITGVGGAGKSSLTDELVRRFLRTFPDRRFAILSVDPTRRRSGGALLGDRIRMNSISNQQVFMRSMATLTPELPTFP